MKRNAALMVLLLLTAVACFRGENQEIQKLQADWQRYVHQKDSLFKYADWSPLLVEDRAHFEGLKYFKYNPGWRFELPLNLAMNVRLCATVTFSLPKIAYLLNWMLLKY